MIKVTLIRIKVNYKRINNVALRFPIYLDHAITRELVIIF